MPCYHPMTAYQCSDGSVVFQERSGRDSVRQLQLPCGQCRGCRLERSRQWAIRCLNEASLWDGCNSFVTLTYGDQQGPASVSLEYRHFQLFMKRLRKAWPGPVRFFMCGEYGETFGRPHFHAILFNVHFVDRVFHTTSPSGAAVYRSAELESFWPHGFSSVGDVTFESAAYVARYVMKKITGQFADEHYRVVDTVTGELVDRVPEFCHMSLKPGIGARWIDKYLTDVYPNGMMVVNGREVKPPRYYDRRFAKVSDDEFAELCARRDALARSNFLDNSDARLAVKEQVVTARVSRLKRCL